MKKKKDHDQPSPPLDSTEDFELALSKTDSGVYVLRLYVSGLTPNSQRAVENVKKLCEKHLKGRYELEIIDIYQQPASARQGHIVAAPTLVKELPPPLRRFIGDMSHTERLLSGLDIRSKG